MERRDVNQLEGIPCVRARNARCSGFACIRQLSARDAAPASARPVMLHRPFVEPHEPIPPDEDPAVSQGECVGETKITYSAPHSTLAAVFYFPWHIPSADCTEEPGSNWCKCFLGPKVA